MRAPAFLMDPYIRRAARFHELPMDRFRIRIARSVQEYEGAFRLLRVAYVYQGYESTYSDALRVTPHHLFPDSTVLVAFEGSELVGTMTVTLDADVGLPIDRYYSDALQRLRGEGRRLVEYGSLAVVGRCRGSGLTQLLNMAAYNLAYRKLGATDCVIEVHPKAVPVYRALFNFQLMGAPHKHELNLDIVGLHHDMTEAQRFVMRHYKKPMATGRLPIDHFLGRPPPCIELPEKMSPLTLADWKLPKPVFQELFEHRTSAVDTLPNGLRERLRAAWLAPERHRNRDDLSARVKLEHVTPRTSGQ